MENIKRSDSEASDLCAPVHDVIAPVAVMYNVDDNKPTTHEEPHTLSEFFNLTFDSENKNKGPHKIIGTLTVNLQKPGYQLTSNDHDIVMSMMRALSNICILPFATDKGSKREFELVDWVLLTLLGKCPMAKRPYAFPGDIQEQATIVTLMLDDLPRPGTPVPVTPPISTSPMPTSHHTGPPKKGSVRHRRLFANDPFTTTLMCNISLTGGRGDGPRSYAIHDLTQKKPANVVGHNGISIGQWWPFRVCMIRDGAHGASQGGIDGGEKSGAFAIVVAGGEYEGMDSDLGDILYYSGSGSSVNTDPVSPNLTRGVKALRHSMKVKRPIRVIRSSAGKGAFAPSCGYRYDGLYTIEREDSERNKLGGAYLRFKLSRASNPASIDMSRPNQQERTAFARLKKMVREDSMGNLSGETCILLHV